MINDEMFNVYGYIPGVGAQLPSEELRLYYYVVHKQTPLRYVRPVEYANDNVHVEISLALIGLDGLVCQYSQTCFNKNTEIDIYH